MPPRARYSRQGRGRPAMTRRAGGRSGSRWCCKARCWCGMRQPAVADAFCAARLGDDAGRDLWQLPAFPVFRPNPRPYQRGVMAGADARSPSHAASPRSDPGDLSGLRNWPGHAHAEFRAALQIGPHQQPEIKASHLVSDTSPDPGDLPAWRRKPKIAHSHPPSPSRPAASRAANGVFPCPRDCLHLRFKTSPASACSSSSN